jgi:predicted ABC-type ATPase
MAIPDQTLEINPDVYKESLPEYDDGRGSSRVHEESSWIARQVLLVAIARSCDLLNDAVGSDAAKYRALISRLRESHYAIHLLCVHVLDVEVLLDRVVRRSLKTRRTVPENFVREAHAKVPVAFELLRHQVDLAEMIDGHDNRRVYAEAGGRVGERVPEFLGKLGEVGRKLLA